MKLTFEYGKQKFTADLSDSRKNTEDEYQDFRPSMVGGEK